MKEEGRQYSASPLLLYMYYDLLLVVVFIIVVNQSSENSLPVVPITNETLVDNAVLKLIDIIVLSISVQLFNEEVT